MKFSILDHVTISLRPQNYVVVWIPVAISIRLGLDRSAEIDLLFTFSEILWLLSLQKNDALKFITLGQVGIVTFSHLLLYE